MTPLQQNDGFTLPELMTVLVIIGLVLAAVPAIYVRVVPGAQFEAATRQVMRDLRHARGEARATNTVQVVSVSNEGRAYAIGERVEKLPKGVVIAIKPRIALDDEGEVRFIGQDGASGADIVLTSSTREKHLSVEWVTGRVSEVTP